MRHTQSLKKNHAFRRVYQHGQSAANRLLVLYVLPNGANINRLGLTVGKKVGCAVVRNRVKRRLREQYRLMESEIPTGYDVVFVARGAAGALSKPEAFMELGRAMRHLIKKQPWANRS